MLTSPRRCCSPDPHVCADDKDDEGEDKEEGNDQDTDIFELEGQREDLQLDPSKFDGLENGVIREGGQQEGDAANNRVTGRSGFEGKVTDEAPSTSGREQVILGSDSCIEMDVILGDICSHS